MNRLQALVLLQECTGDDIWSVEHCLQRGLPQSWIDDLADCFESNFDQDLQTIYVDDRPTNQYHGLRDIDIARKLSEVLRLPFDDLASTATSRRALVKALQEAAEEL